MAKFIHRRAEVTAYQIRLDEWDRPCIFEPNGNEPLPGFFTGYKGGSNKGKAIVCDPYDRSNILEGRLGDWLVIESPRIARIYSNEDFLRLYQVKENQT
jgi:hypothetical protein